jgi:hypothetical protein
MSEPTEYRKENVLAVLRHAGVPEETLDEIERTLPDRVDAITIGNLLGPFGITHDFIFSRMGASP